jgi:hypothetical protein
MTKKMTPRLKELLDACTADAIDTLLSNGELPFRTMFLPHAGEAIVCHADIPKSLDLRDRLVGMLRLIATECDAEAVVISAETWSAPHDASSDIRPSESSSRKEYLWVCMMCRGGDGLLVLQTYREIVRDEAEAIVGLGEVDQPSPCPCDPASGLFYRILPPKRPSSKARRHARKALDGFAAASASADGSGATVH